MSQVTKEQATAAYQSLYNELHAPVFFHKLAEDFGIVPNGPEETAELLQLGGKLRALYTVKQAQAASPGSSMLKRANAHLDKLLQDAGVAKPAAASDEQEIKTAAAHVALNPKYARDILTLVAGVGTAA